METLSSSASAGERQSLTLQSHFTFLLYCLRPIRTSVLGNACCKQDVVARPPKVAAEVDLEMCKLFGADA